MPINGHTQNMLAIGAGNGVVCMNPAVNGNMSNCAMNTNGTSNGAVRNGHRNANAQSQSHHHLSSVSTSSSPTGFMHESHSNSSLIAPPMSPNSQDGFPPGYDMSAHLKRKELFTQRKQREFIPDNKKDDSYWDRRRRNNEAAKRSREKRRYNDMVLEQRVVELTKENHVLKAQLDAIKDKYNICGENLVSVEQIMATLPTTEQVLSSITKRPKFNNSGPSPNSMYPASPSPPMQTSVIQQSSASVESSPPPPSSTGPTTIVSPTSVVSQASPIQSSAAAAAAAFAHLNNTYLEASSQRNNYKYRDNGISEMDGRHEMYGRSNFHVAAAAAVVTAEHVPPPPPTNGNSFNVIGNGNGNVNVNGCNGSSAINGTSRYNQHVSPISRTANSQTDHHRHQPHPVSSHHHIHPLQQHFEANEASSVNKISQSNAGSDTDINAIEDDSNVLNLSRRRNSDTNSNNNNNTNNNNNLIAHNNNNHHKSKNGSSTPPRSVYASIGNVSVIDDDQYADNQPMNDTNNSLPLKLRHKSHLGDKDAATALLSLQHIKQEPHLRLSPPYDSLHDGEGSSDERDSGISIGTAEWGIQRKILIPSSVGIGGIGAAIGNLAANLSGVGVVGGLTMGSVLAVNDNSSDRDERNHLRYSDPKSFRAPVMCHLEINSSNGDEGNVKEENVHLKTQIARLESEVASIKNMMILSTTSASATAVQ